MTRSCSHALPLFFSNSDRLRRGSGETGWPDDSDERDVDEAKAVGKSKGGATLAIAATQEGGKKESSGCDRVALELHRCNYASGAPTKFYRAAAGQQVETVMGWHAYSLCDPWRLVCPHREARGRGRALGRKGTGIPLRKSHAASRSEIAESLC